MKLRHIDFRLTVQIVQLNLFQVCTTRNQCSVIFSIELLFCKKQFFFQLISMLTLPMCFSIVQDKEHVQPRSQVCIRTTLAQSNDSSILIGRQFFIPNSNELLKIVGMQTRSLQFRQLLHSKRSTVRNSLAGGVMSFPWSFLILLTYGSTTSHDSTMDYSRE